MNRFLSLRMPDGLTKINARYDALLWIADSIYSQKALEQCYTMRHDRHNTAYSAATENFICGYLGLSLGSLTNQDALAEPVKRMLRDDEFRTKLEENAALLLDMLVRTADGYVPVLCDGTDIAVMTQNAFANDILVHIDGTDGLEYAPEQLRAFRVMAQFWGDYFVQKGVIPTGEAGRMTGMANDNGPDRLDMFVGALENNLREMGITRVQNGPYPSGALTLAFDAAEIAVPRLLCMTPSHTELHGHNEMGFAVDTGRGTLCLSAANLIPV